MSDNQQHPLPDRTIAEMPHEFLVEKVQLLESYIASMLNMIIQHHPYLSHAANQIGREFSERDAEVECRYPRSPLIVPPSGLTIVKG